MEYWFKEGCYIEEWSNSPTDPECSVAHVRIPAQGQTRWHRLMGTSERYVILQGEGIVEVCDAPARKVKPRDVVIIAPELRQRIFNPGPEDLRFLAVCTPRFVIENYSDCE